MRPLHEHIVDQAAEQFREELLGSMRNAMLKAAQEEIEHILHEYSKCIDIKTQTFDDVRDMSRVHTIQMRDRNPCAHR